MSLHRRDFITTTLTAATAAALAPLQAGAADTEPAAADAREYFELRAYWLHPAALDHALLDAYLAQALIPALNARGIAEVGVFVDAGPTETPAVWVMIPHRTFASIAAVAELASDPAVLAAATDYLTTPDKNRPAFARLDSWLLHAFRGMPGHAVPALARSGQDRIYELRVYESFSEAKCRKKVDMFNAGEIELFRELGFDTVFFGEALAGPDLPHLAYVLCSPDRATHDAAWKAFFAHPTWLQLKNDSQYADTVSKVISRFLRATSYSQM